MNTNFKTTGPTSRRPLTAVAGDVRRGTQPTAGRLLADTGRKSVGVASFSSSV